MTVSVSTARRMELHELGWNGEWERVFEPFHSRGWQPGRVAVEDKHSYGLLTEGGPLTASVAGRLLHRTRLRADLPKVGDWVALAPASDRTPPSIQAVVPRRNQLARNDTHRPEREQVLAANVDQAFVVQALDQSFHPSQLARCLALVREGGVAPVVVLNKADLCADLAAAQAAVRAVEMTAPLACASAETGGGLSELTARLAPGRTVVFIGPSGVGKSSLINRLYGAEVQATLEVRESDARGRHTTTWRELIRLPGGALVIDTPGLREFPVGPDAPGMMANFPDIVELALGCHFRQCTHTAEARCAVRVALAEGRLPRERYDRFLHLQRELDYLAEERRRHTYHARRRERGQQ